VVIWREDPEATHPRLLERLGFRGDGSRALAVVDDRDTPTAARATLRLQWRREHDLDALVSLHALAQDRPAAGELDAQLAPLMGRVREVPHVAFVYGPGLAGGDGGQRRALALHELTRAMSHERHVVTLPLPPAAGITGAQDVLAWQAGYAGNVDFASGHPELLVATHPTEDVDVALRLGGEAVAIGLGPDLDSEPSVWIRTAAPGVEVPGTAHRLDGVPLALQAPLASDAPTAATVLARLLAEVSR
jgi:formylmethanofuran dehydrogenase subunit B